MATDFAFDVGDVFDPMGDAFTDIDDCDWPAGSDFDSAADCLNGSSWTIGGVFTADGQTLNATAVWYLTVTGLATASGVGSVAWCDASGGTEIDASEGPWDDSGNNLGWNFGGITVTDATTLFISSHQPVTDATTLFISSHQPVTENIPLFVNGRSIVTPKEFPLYLTQQVEYISYVTRNKNMNLYK